MKRASRIALGSAVLAGGLVFAAAAPASAQVRIGGSFPLPHGRISFSVGDAFPIGGYVPYGYDVYEDPDYGYGFVYEDQWIPCAPRGNLWVIVGSPFHYGHRDYRYGRSYRNDRYYSYRQHDRRGHDGRSYRRDGGRRWRDGDRRDWDRNRRDRRDGDRRWRH